MQRPIGPLESGTRSSPPRRPWNCARSASSDVASQSELDKLSPQELLRVGAAVDLPRIKDTLPLDDTAFAERSPRRRRDRAPYRLQSGRCDLDAVLDRERSRRHGAV